MKALAYFGLPVLVIAMIPGLLFICWMREWGAPEDPRDRVRREKLWRVK